VQRRWWMIGLLTLVLLASIAIPASAGVLTANNYTYLLRGRELDLPVDILSVQGAYLVPDELLAALGLTPAYDGDAIGLTRGSVTVELMLGSEIAQVAGKARQLKAAPMKVSKRSFVPAEVLADLGYSLTVDGKFVLLADYAPATPPPALSQSEFDGVLKAHTVQGTIRDGSTYATVTVTALTAELLGDERLGIPWGTRLKLLQMLKTRTLLLVTMRNQSVKAVAFDPAKLMLVTDGGSQADYLKTEVAVDGSVTSPVAPGAVRTSVLAYSQIETDEFDLYHDGAGAVLGRLPAR